LQAEGYSLALQTIFNVARNIDPKTLALQYMDTLKQLGASPSTKYIFPMEFAGLAQGLTQFLQQAGTTGSSDASMVEVPNSTAIKSASGPSASAPSGSGTGTSQTST
jgi:hypothetical protein